MNTTKSYTIKDIQEGLKRKDFSEEEIFSYYKDKIKKENKAINAYLSVFDFINPKSEIRNPKSRASLLNGVPCAIKDNMLINGTVCTAASKILKDYVSSYDATAINKLKACGSQFLGKTNLDEFAMGSSTENSAYGPTKNPHDNTRVAGGSSGGSAAAVAADLCVFSLGSDTAGSIRLPASFCGVVGLKPTYGRVSRHGLIAMASSLDQIGPITKNVYDAALVLSAISGLDKFDSTTVARKETDYTDDLKKDIKGLKVGIPKEFFGEGLDEEVKLKTKETIDRLRKSGCEMINISLPNSEYSIAAYYIIMPSEVSSNLARYDGIRYGYSDKGAKELKDVYINSKTDGLGDEAKRRIMLGTHALSSGYYDAYYLKAQKVRTLIKNDFDEVFKKVDLIVGPTAPSTAFKLGEKSTDPLSMYMMDIYTASVNLAGLPAISVPNGVGSLSGLPVGFQIIGKMFDESTILRLAHHIHGS
jgi:aspartyl-tRNA(Asn)/glutamyl-tRNA(Gln) amidotransferase subunit A